VSDIENDCDAFLATTGFMPPGKDEPAAEMGQLNFKRHEVRALLWNLWCYLKKENSGE